MDFCYLAEKYKHIMATVIGREKEISELRDAWSSEKAQFVAVYGRWEPN